MKPKIQTVEPGSLAAAVDIRPGDLLLAVNDQPVQDLIDYRYGITEEEVHLLLQRGEQVFSLAIEKELDEDLGLGFESAVFDRIRPCTNRCLFCFVAQQPPGLRDSLYIKDDDYRMSFLQGSYVTLTNLRKQDWQRIEDLHLGPLFVSVHATNPELRARLLNNPKAASIREDLDRLVEAGSCFHAQIVLLPGLNDGPELERTLEELSAYLPEVLSIAVVPLGMTRFRENLPSLTPASPEWAREVIRLVQPWQKRFQKEEGDPIVRLADEFYLLAGEPFPPLRHYGGFLQYEDGIGPGRLFLSEWAKQKRRLRKTHGKVTLVTGKAAESILRPSLDDLRAVGLEADLKAIPSLFWGGRITVTGLLTGTDLIEGLRGVDGEIWVPSILLRHGSDRFLDGLSVSEVEAKLGRPLRMLPPSAAGLVEAVRSLG